MDCSPYASKTLDAVLAALKSAVTGGARQPDRRRPTVRPEPASRSGDVDRRTARPDLPTVPIVVMNASQHFFYVNSAAYAKAGITADTPNPPGETTGP